MKNQSLYHLKATFAFLAFVILGYVVKFYPDRLVGFDSTLQTFVRGQLPSVLTHFFKTVTVLGNTEVQIGFVLVMVVFFVSLKWKAEAIWLGLNGSLVGLLIVGLKHLYERPRPSLEHLVEAGGFSFPSGHSLGSFLILGTLVVIFGQRLSGQWQRLVVQCGLSFLILMIGMSRIYLGVHYPTDVLAGFVLGFAVLNLGFPFYDYKRFKWRFQSKQK